MTQLLQSGFGIEELGTEVYINLFSNLNDIIDEVEASKAPLDQRIAATRGETYDPVRIERVEPQHLYLHNSPSVINPDSEPLDSFPSVSIVAFRTSPDEADSDYDQAEEFTDLLYTEHIVKASPKEGAEICGKRVYRMADAIHACISKDRTVGGLVSDLGPAPQLIVSQVFKRPEFDGHGDDWFWQVARIDYTLTKVSPFQY